LVPNYQLLTGDELEINSRLFPNKALKWKEDFHRELRLQVVMTEGVTSAFERADADKSGEVAVGELLPLVQTLQSQRKQHHRGRHRKRLRRCQYTVYIYTLYTIHHTLNALYANCTGGVWHRRAC
jgi:hypothetical protein